MNNHHRVKVRDEAGQQTDEQESGQIILIMALAMVGLLVAAGLAADAGVLFMRKSLLDRAVDSAALAGVVELDTTMDPGSGSSDPNLPRAHVRGMQLLAANDIVLTNGDNCPDPIDDATYWSTHDYCGEKRSGAIPGSIRYAAYARWYAPLFFMPIIGFDDVPLRANAEAEYMSLVDIYASDTNEIGVIKTSTQAIFGPDICPGFGDPYTPTNNPDGSPNASWDELYGAYTYRISVPPSFFDGGRSEVRAEIFDPDTYNQPGANHDVYRLNGSWLPNNNGCATARKSTCTINTGDADNPVWFVTMDENRGRGNVGECYDQGSYRPQYNTRTLYRLYYYEQDYSGNLIPVDLAYYIGESDGTDPAEAAATDMHWVSPGATGGELMPPFDGTAGNESCVFDKLVAMGAIAAGDVVDPFCEDAGVGGEPAVATQNCETYRAAHYGDPWDGGYTTATRCEGDGNFVVDFDSEVPGIFEDPSSGVKQLFLQVRGFSGASENSYELWAGPSLTEDPTIVAPSEVNARQVFLQVALANGQVLHRSQGAGVFGIGHLPMNSVAGGILVDIPLTYLGPQFAGQQMKIDVYDTDSGGRDPILFYFDSVPLVDWGACYDDNGSTAYGTCPGYWNLPRLGPANIENNGHWTNPPYEFTIPSDASGVPFYGGRLYARYQAGQNDTYGWRITLEGRPFLTQ
jgi:hypothetical protein